MFFNALPNFIFNAFAPIECLNCGQGNDWYCPACQQKLLSSQAEIIIDNYSDQITKIFCAHSYQNKLVQELIQTCKYDGIENAISPLANQLGDLLKTQLSPTTNYILVPVPLHPRRQRERGFNQSQIIAEVIAKKLNLSVLSTERLINTPHQVGLNGEQRQKNMKNVFGMASVGMSVGAQWHCAPTDAIIIDDVITTGATIKSLATILRPYFKNIYAAALAKE